MEIGQSPHMGSSANHLDEKQIQKMSVKTPKKTYQLPNDERCNAVFSLEDTGVLLLAYNESCALLCDGLMVDIIQSR